jgi:diketogulonate reductase-like aldo/keto reductase
MEQRVLAATGVRIPVIGLGTWQYSGGIGPLEKGIALGASFVDTAEAYGTEEVVGRAVHTRRREIFLATKVSPRHFRYADVIAAAEASLRRLNTDYIDLYQLHWPNYTIPITETMQAMEHLVDSGKIRFIGVSNFYVPDLKKAQHAMTKHRIVSNQVRFNLVDRTAELGLLNYCRDQSITVIAHSPLATGMQYIRKNDAKGVLDNLAKSLSCTPAQIAIGWCISREAVVTIPKSDRTEHVSENCAASQVRLSAQDLDTLNRNISAHSRGTFESNLRRAVRFGLQIAGKNQ